MKNAKQKISEAIVGLNFREIDVLTEDALQAGIEPLEIINDALVPAMSIVGRKFKNGEFFLAEIMLSGRIMKRALSRLLPILSQSDTQNLGHVAIGTVKGDVHDIGKNIVVSMLEGNGFKVLDLGVDVEPEKFVEVIRQNEIRVLALSSLLTSTMPMLDATIRALEEERLRTKTKVIVGGAPVTRDYANKIGADGYGADAVEAVDITNAIVSNNK